MRSKLTRHLLIFSSFGLSVAGLALAGQDAAPSSHMVYNDASFDGDILINEVRVPKDGEAMYTYYEALGWGGRAAGYAGIQAHPKARNYIFSIWDHKEHSAPIRAVFHGPGTKTEKFGGEGTGLKSWNFELGCDTGVWYTLVARCWLVGDHTYYGYWVRSEKTGEWTHMVTMDVAAEAAYFKGGNDSFIEDWLETGENSRTTHLRKGWKRKPDGEWHAFGKARYSVNHWDLTEGKRSYNFRTNWDGGVAEDAGGKYYFMTSGGATTTPTSANPSEHSIERSEKAPEYAAIQVSDATAKIGAGGKLVVDWNTEVKSLPQFSYSLDVKLASEGGGQSLAKVEKVEAQDRQVTIELPAGVELEKLRVELSVEDILGNRPAPVQVQISLE